MPGIGPSQCPGTAASHIFAIGEHEVHMSGTLAKPKTKSIAAKAYKNHKWPCLIVLPCVEIPQSVLLSMKELEM